MCYDNLRVCANHRIMKANIMPQANQHTQCVQTETRLFLARATRISGLFFPFTDYMINIGIKSGCCHFCLIERKHEHYPIWKGQCE